jgi:hypothetical protein
MTNVLIIRLKKLEKSEDNKNHLKSMVWPMLQAFFNATDVEDFRSCFSHSVLELENANNAEMEKMLATQFEGLLQAWLSRGRFRTDGRTDGRWPRGHP